MKLTAKHFWHTGSNSDTSIVFIVTYCYMKETYLQLLSLHFNISMIICDLYSNVSKSSTEKSLLMDDMKAGSLQGNSLLPVDLQTLESQVVTSTFRHT